MLVIMWQIKIVTQKIVRVGETTHKIGSFFDVIHKFQSPIFCFQIKIARENWLINKTCHIKIARVDGTLGRVALFSAIYSNCTM